MLRAMRLYRNFVILTMTICSTVCAKSVPNIYHAKCGKNEINKTLSKLNTVQDFHDYALSVLIPQAIRYYDLGAMDQNTLYQNVEAFKRLIFRPRMWRNVSERYMNTSFLGFKATLPIGIAPSALHKMASKGGEDDTARAACDAGALMILSSLSTSSLEEVAAAAPECERWHQIYFFTNRSVTIDMIHRAVAHNYKALVLTVDAPIFGRSLEHEYLTLPQGLNYGNLQKYIPHGTTDIFKYLTLDTTLTWDIIEWTKRISNLPVIVKGVLTGEDAIIAARSGAAAIIVSNHGGRQLDNAPATIEVLPEVVRAVRGMDVEIYMDGGIRHGTDVLAALTLGAKAVFIGRPNLWGLSACGAVGARKVLERLRSELDLAMALSGVTSKDNIPKNLIVSPKYFNKKTPQRGI